MRMIDRVESAFVDHSGERGAVERMVVLTCTLYCLLLIALPSTYGASVAWLIALVGAVRGGVWRAFYERYRFALWGMVALVVINALVARFPAKVAPGAVELIRSVSFMLPAMYVMQHCSRRMAVVAVMAGPRALESGSGCHGGCAKQAGLSGLLGTCVRVPRLTAAPRGHPTKLAMTRIGRSDPARAARDWRQCWRESTA